MLILRGAPALSEFRLKKLAQRLSGLFSGKVGVVSEYLHFADVDQSLDERDRAVLDNLLRYGPAMPDIEHAGTLLLVVPRPGTLSPWSTKATDIAHHCGLQKIQRLERGLAYYLTIDG